MNLRVDIYFDFVMGLFGMTQGPKRPFWPIGGLRFWSKYFFFNIVIWGVKNIAQNHKYKVWGVK